MGRTRWLRPAGTASERIVLHVLRGEAQWLPGDDLVTRQDGVGAGPFAFVDSEAVTGLALDLALGEIFGGVIGHIAEADRIPEMEPPDRAIEHVFRRDARHAQSRDFDS